MLQKHAEGLWTLDHPMKLMGLDLGIRMTVVRLKDGGLWLYSAVPLTDEAAREVEALGPVRFIVAPSLFHHLFAGKAKARFPSAKLLVAPGLPEKRKTLSHDGVLGTAPDPGYASDLEQRIIGGMPKMNEAVFLHRASRTLIVTDCFFYVPRPRNWLTWLYMKLSGTIGALCQTKVYRALIRNRGAFRASMEAVGRWDFDRVIVSHGEVLPTGGKAAFEKATAWLR
ncbi:MAG TPA: DUF4336 domain-containing protein [bacterium]